MFLTEWHLLKNLLELELIKINFVWKIAILCATSDAWLYGCRGSSDYGRDLDSRKWCDDMLKLLGWE